jgi:peptide/nickel transport system ATP-binding protein
MAEADRLAVEGLRIQAADRVLVDDAAFTIRAGTVVALVGASGSGKTLSARACLGLVRARPGVVAGRLQVEVDGELHQPYDAVGLRARERAFAPVRGRLVGYLPQEARASLDPLWTVEQQVREVVGLRNSAASGEELRARHWLRLAGFADPDEVAPLFPHELSGGMAQRACIALALARGSRFLLADEPTTGLDPTVQQGILEQIRRLRERDIGVLFITHDLRLVPRIADEVLVMHDGQIVDRVAADDLQSAASPHTRRLLEATARVAGGHL